MVDWLSNHNQTENREQEISDMNISTHMISTTLDTPKHMSIEDIKAGMNKDTELEMLQWYIIRGFLDTNDEVSQVY